ncbi:MAG TPA: hypothetical protein VJ044_11530, partial [Candidatus Hodarchaeales archaeon]|nr:hypothetical protein [Candidatus Hodarchaeales archaeon]
SVRIGVATFPRFGTARLLKKFLNSHPVASKSLQDAIITKKRGGVVAACGPVKQAHAPGFLAAGDAAGQVKATTGGGVNIGGFCGRLAGYVATQNILNGVPLKKYDNLWKREYYLELRLMEIYRKIVGQLSDYALDQAIKAASGSAFEKKLSKTVDIDRHSLDLIRATLSPRPVLAGVKMLPELLWASGKFLLSEFQFS